MKTTWENIQQQQQQQNITREINKNRPSERARERHTQTDTKRGKWCCTTPNDEITHTKNHISDDDVHEVDKKWISIWHGATNIGFGPPRAHTLSLSRCCLAWPRARSKPNRLEPSACTRAYMVAYYPVAYESCSAHTHTHAGVLNNNVHHIYGMVGFEGKKNTMLYLHRSATWIETNQIGSKRRVQQQQQCRWSHRIIQYQQLIGIRSFPLALFRCRWN